MKNAITVKNLTKKFIINHTKNISKDLDSIIAVNNISFEVKKGEMFGIIGLNGSGKSTLLRIIAGIYYPDKGTVEVNGKLAPVLQIGVGFHKELTPKENIIMFGMLMGIPKKDIGKKIEKILDFAELKKFKELKIKHFSAGMKARLAFSTVLEIETDIILIDEVLSVGDIKFKDKSLQAFLEFKRKGKTIVLTSHSMGTISKFCDRVMLLDEGKMIDIGKPDEIISKYKENANIDL